MRTATYKSTDLEVSIYLTYGGLRYKLTQRRTGTGAIATV